MIKFSDYKFIPCPYDDGRGDGDLLVPLEVFGTHPESIEVVHDDRVGTFKLSGQTYHKDSVAGTREFVGWSYWEDGPDVPAVNLMVLSPDFNLENYNG